MEALACMDSLQSAIALDKQLNAPDGETPAPASAQPEEDEDDRYERLEPVSAFQVRRPGVFANG